MHGQELPPSFSSPWITDLEVYDIITYAMLVRTGEVKWEKKDFDTGKAPVAASLSVDGSRSRIPFGMPVLVLSFLRSSVASLFYYIPNVGTVSRQCFLAVSS